MPSKDDVIIRLITETKESIASLGQYAIAITAIITAVKSAVKIAKDLTAAYMEQEKAEILLTAASKNNPLINNEAVRGLRDYAAELQRASIYGDEQIIQQEAFLTTLGLTEQQIKDIMQASINLASTGIISLEGATRNIAKTFAGMTGELGELIPTLKTLTKEELENGDAVKFLNEKYKGMGEAVGQTAYGAIEKYKNALSDLKEKGGELIAKFILPFVEGMTKLVELLNNFITKTKDARWEVGELKKESEWLVDVGIDMRNEWQKSWEAMALGTEKSLALVAQLRDQLLPEKKSEIDLLNEGIDLLAKERKQYTANTETYKAIQAAIMDLIAARDKLAESMKEPVPPPFEGFDLPANYFQTNPNFVLGLPSEFDTTAATEALRELYEARADLENAEIDRLTELGQIGMDVFSGITDAIESGNFALSDMKGLLASMAGELMKVAGLYLMKTGMGMGAAGLPLVLAGAGLMLGGAWAKGQATKAGNTVNVNVGGSIISEDNLRSWVTDIVQESGGGS